ncbi:MAG: ABC transporter substrate-binding protein [Anaerolineae bacterium]
MNALMNALRKLISLALLMAILAACGATQTVETPAEPTTAPTEESPAAATTAPTEVPEEPTEEPTGESAYQESPMLAAMVASGDLPPIEERLPKDVAVVEPRDAIGQYNEQIRLQGYYEGSGVFSQLTEDMTQGLLMIDVDYTQFGPNIAKDWELSEDGTTLTLYLREGMKWSDGDDFTADDFAFWYEDILQDPDITVSISRNWQPGGELMGFTKIDDYSVQYIFAAPYFRAVEVFAGALPAAPEHYVKQYMPEYSDDAEAKAEAEGFETWQQAVQHVLDSYDADPNVPTLNPWKIKDLSAGSALWERNPYYWRVDTAGNQLPYADTLLVLITETPQVAGTMRTLAGEIDFTDYTGLSLEDYPMLKQREAEGGFRVGLWTRADESTAMGFALNYTHPDPELREIFSDLRFRQALSLAINRDEISENLFYGLTEPWTAPVSAAWTGYEDWMGTYYAEYDVERANTLLDEMGLEWDAAGEYRLRSDGTPLTIIGQYCTEWLAYSEDLLDLVSLHWQEIGVKFEPKFVPEETLQTLFVANETDIGISNSDGGAEMSGRANYPIRLIPPWHWGSADCCPMSSYSWRQWLDTDGAEGTEPPDDVKRMYDLTMQWLQQPYGTDEYASLINEVITINVENLYYFGTVSAAPMVVAANAKMVNVPIDDGVFNAWAMTPYLPETWFLQD